MSDQAQRVLDALLEYDAINGIGYPMAVIYKFFYDLNDVDVYKDYQALTIEEEKQVIQAFLEIAY